MRKFLNRTFIEILVIIVIGFIPLLWFQGNEVILGHDSGLVISPVSHFFDRLYLWTYRFGLGHDQTYALSGFMIHGLEALISTFVKDLQLTQKIFFVFWFLLPGLSMYLFGRYIEKRLELQNIAIISSVFYMVNHFLLQGWFIAERTKFSLYAALPIFLLLLFLWVDKKVSTITAGVLIALLFFFLNGNASFPLFGGILIVFFVFLLVFVYPLYKTKRILSFIFLLFISGALSLLLNLYWFLPFYNFVKSSYTQAVAQVGGVSGVLTWVNYISRDSSILNLIRLQGIPEWYQNPDHPYSNVFLSNPLFIFIGFLLPILVFAILFFVTKFKDVKLVLFFLLLAIVSIVFVAGSHPPFGAFYIFMVKFVPGFVAFRTPFYKFAPALWFAYSVLIGMSISYLLSHYFKRNFVPTLLVAVTVIGIIVYSYPFINGSFFHYIKDKRTMKTYVPQYIYDFRDWVDGERIDGKIVALPFSNRSFKVDAYDWNFWSLSPVSSLLTSAPIINRNGMSEDELQIFDQIDYLMRSSDPSWKTLARLIDIQYFLVRHDFVADSEGSVTFPLSSYMGAMKDSDVKLVQKFGSWEVYELIDKENSQSQLTKLEGGNSKIGIVATLPNFDSNDIVYTNSVGENADAKLMSITSKTYMVPGCIFCNLEYAPLNRDLYRPLITKGSIFYSIAELQDRQKVSKLEGMDKSRHYLYKSLEFLLAFDKVVIEEKELSSIPLILDAYDGEIEKFKMSLSDLLVSNQNLNDFLLEVENVLRIEEELINDNASKLTDKVLLDRVSRSFTLMRAVKDITLSHLWRTEDEIHKRFLVTVPENDSYRFYLRTNYPVNNFDTLQYKINDQLGEKLAIEKTGWIDLGIKQLQKGLQRLEFTVPTTNIYTSEKSKDIISTKNGSCYSSEIFNALPGEEYKISFNHIRLKGNKKFYFKINTFGQKPNILDKTDSAINSQGQWDTYETIYKAANIPTDQFYFSVCDAPDLTEKFSSAIKIDAINVRRITTPDLVIERTQSDNHIEVIEAKKMEPTKYTLAKKDNGVVVLSTSYNNGWDINGQSVKFTANGYANGWLVSEDNKGDIEYKPQQLVKTGFIVSGITFIVVILYLLYAIFKKKN